MQIRVKTIPCVLHPLTYIWFAYTESVKLCLARICYGYTAKKRGMLGSQALARVPSITHF